MDLSGARKAALRGVGQARRSAAMAAVDVSYVFLVAMVSSRSRRVPFTLHLASQFARRALHCVLGLIRFHPPFFLWRRHHASVTHATPLFFHRRALVTLSTLSKNEGVNS